MLLPLSSSRRKTLGAVSRQRSQSMQLESTYQGPVVFCGNRLFLSAMMFCLSLSFSLCASLGIGGSVRFLRLFFRKSPQIVFAEFGTTGTAASVTILTERAVTDVNGAELSADIAPEVRIRRLRRICLFVLVHALPSSILKDESRPRRPGRSLRAPLR